MAAAQLHRRQVGGGAGVVNNSGIAPTPDVWHTASQPEDCSGYQQWDDAFDSLNKSCSPVGLGHRPWLSLSWAGKHHSGVWLELCAAACGCAEMSSLLCFPTGWNSYRCMIHSSSQIVHEVHSDKGYPGVCAYQKNSCGSNEQSLQKFKYQRKDLLIKVWRKQPAKPNTIDR